MKKYELILNGFSAEQYQDESKLIDRPRLILIIWPSTGGNARSFRIKESELISQKILLIRYNPTSHGDSFGNYHPSESIEDLVQFLRKKDLLAIPTVGIGHSGGGAALVMMQEKIQFSKRYLLSPILNSRLSLEFLYANGNIHEFLELLKADTEPGQKSPSGQTELIFSTLGNSNWLKTGEIGELDFGVSNHRIHLESLATFLRNLFLPGFDITEPLLKSLSPIEIFLPMEDRWFPREKTLAFGNSPGIKITEIASAKDHFFTASWLTVWQKIKSEIYT